MRGFYGSTYKPAGQNDRIDLTAALGDGGFVAINKSGERSTAVVWFKAATGPVGQISVLGAEQGLQASDLIMPAGTKVYITGDAGNDILVASSGIDTFTGGDGFDAFIFRAAADTPLGGGGDYITDFTTGQDWIDLRDVGSNLLVAIDRAANGASTVFFQAASGVGGTGQIGVNGVVQASEVFAGPGSRYWLTGSAVGETLTGSTFADVITGAGGADAINGRGGGDRFVYTAVSDSTVAARDTITGFVSGSDKLDLTALGSGSLSISNSGGFTLVDFTPAAGGGTLEVALVGQNAATAADVLRG